MRLACALVATLALAACAGAPKKTAAPAKTEPKPAKTVASAPQPVKLVFLSACQSAKGGDAGLQNVLLAKGVPAILGMNESVPLKATMTLAGPFYSGLAAGMTIARAFENALPALKNLENGSMLQKIPVLEGPGKDARILPARVTGRASFALP